jgi:hypothetical protein
LVWPFIYFLAFSASGVSRYYWYYAPLVPGFIVLVGLGTASIQNGIEAGLSKSKLFPSNTSFISNLVAGGIVLALFFGSASRLLTSTQWKDPRYAIYREVGEWIRSNSNPGQAVGTLEVGIIGYYSDRPLVGFAGLILPDVAGRLTPKSTYADSAVWAVERYRPEYLVLQSGHFPELETGYAALNCQVVRRFSGGKYGYGNNIDIYFCRKD